MLTSSLEHISEIYSTKFFWGFMGCLNFDKIIRKMKWVGALCFAFAPFSVDASIGDGPRAYLPPPVNSTIVTVYGMGMGAEYESYSMAQNKDFDAYLAVAQLTQTVDLFGYYAALTAILPYAQTQLNMPLGQRDLKRQANGLSDIQLLFTLGLYNLPPLSMSEYSDYQPGFALGALARLILPTGKYSSTNLVNISENRYAMQLGMIASYTLGSSLLDPRLMTLDLLPSITLYSNNRDFYGMTKTQKQSYQLEAHVTKNIKAWLWGSLDGIYSYRGSGEIIDVNQIDAKGVMSFGVTLGVNLSESFGLKASYGRSFELNQGNQVDSYFWRVSLTYININ
ncbi:transporter [Cysteiniphilum litorale]|uniref:transporter n=1 Tax=Cysteiniphilum litorale TaxID=2056700 RepID=UPI003F88340A